MGWRTDVVGHRRRRIHRIERGGEPQRGRPQRHRGQRFARPRGRNGATSPSGSSRISCPPAELARLGSTGASSTPLSIWGRSPTTTATDGDLVIENNFRLSLQLLDWCTATRTPFIYASSAATYGDGSHGFRRRLDVRRRCDACEPMNLYGWSKHLFDLAIADRLRAARGAAAAMGGTQIFQRVRAQRIPQGRHDEHRRQAFR